VVDHAADLRRGGDAHHPDTGLGGLLVVGEGDYIGAALLDQRRQRGGRAAEQRSQHQGRAVGARLAIGLDGGGGRLARVVGGERQVLGA
jgi:hypothetical protein